MIDKKLHNFYLSFKVIGQLHVEWVNGLTLRHAKERLLMQYGDATDVMDWTHESAHDFQQYIDKMKLSTEIKDVKVTLRE